MSEQIEVKINRTAETILGILGGIFGLAPSIIAFFTGMIIAIDPSNISLIIRGLLATLFSILGIAGGAMATRNAKVSGIFMLVGGIGGFIAISIGFIVAGPLLIIGGILALLKESKRK